MTPREESSQVRRPAEAAPAVPAAAGRTEWGPIKRFGFRFFFCYVLLYGFPFPLGFDLTQAASDWYRNWRGPMVAWVGANVFGIDYPIAYGRSGSGDRTFDYLAVFCLLVLASAAAAIWSLFDRRGRRDQQLLEGLRVYIRLYVGTMMLAYGFAKIIPRGQFVPPDAVQLAQTYGDSSPMNLLWTFMGYSIPYTMIAGFLEAISGALLFFRRTTYIGALVLLGVMGNIVLLNFCYDVPVKLFSSHLWLLCLFLAAPSAAPLASLLVLRRSIPLPPPPPRCFSHRSRRARIAATSLYALLVGFLAVQASYDDWKRYIDSVTLSAEAAAVRGDFSVEEMAVDGRVLTPMPGDASRWSRVHIRRRGIYVFRMNDRYEIYRSMGDIEGPMTLDLRLWSDQEGPRRGLLALRREGAGYVLEGAFEGRQVRARLARMKAGDSLLMSRGFHWINEEPLNR